MLGKILGFGHMQQNIFYIIFENALNFFRRKPSILILDLYFTM
jgi:hypothetical protein